MVNRHGLVAGATGTGKTKTLQLMAEQLSAAGVAVFAADIKGDLSGDLAAGREQREAAGPDQDDRPGVDRDRLPDRVLRARRAGHRDSDPGDHHVVRAGAAVEGARAERRPGVVARPDLPLRRQAGPDAARPEGPARGHHAPDQRRGQGRPEGARRAVRGDRRRDPAVADRVRRPGRRGVLRRAGVRHRRPAAAARRQGRRSRCSSCRTCRTGRRCSRPS